MEQNKNENQAVRNKSMRQQFARSVLFIYNTCNPAKRANTSMQCRTAQDNILYKYIYTYSMSREKQNKIIYEIKIFF